MKHEQMSLQQAIIRQIRIELTARDWTQADLAEKVDLRRDTLNRYMRERSPMPMELYFSISAAFGLGPSDLMARAEQLRRERRD